MTTLNIAVVLSEINCHSKSKCIGTFNFIAAAIDSDIRYLGAKVTLTAWDRPTDWSQFSHILLSDGIEYSHCHQQFIAWMDDLPNSEKRVINPPKVIKWNINKIYLLNFQSKGIRIPPTVFIRPGEKPTLNDVVGLLEEQNDSSSLEALVIKSMIDANGSSVKFSSLKHWEQTEAAYTKALETFSTTGTIVQKFFPAIKSDGEWSLVYFGGTFSHAVLKRPASNDFKVQIKFGGEHASVDTSDLPKDILDFSAEVIRAAECGILVYVRVDIVRNPQGLPSLMEFEAFEPSLYMKSKDMGAKLLQSIFKH